MGNTNRVDSSVSPAPHLKEANIPEFPADSSAYKPKQSEMVKSSEMRKRGRPRKSPVETIQNVTALAKDMENLPLPNQVKTLNKDIAFSGGSDIKDRKRTPTNKREGMAVEELINPQNNYMPKKGRKHNTYLRVQEPSPVSGVEKDQGDIAVLEEISEKHHESEVQSLPFVKNSILWKTLDAMEPFQRIPQNPHFQPLQQIKESLREGKAIGYMLTFAGMVEKIYGLQFSDPKSVTDNILEALAELENHGFNVKPINDHVLELLVVKEKGANLVVDVKKINGRILAHRQQKDKVEEEIVGLKKEIQKMKQRLSVLESTKEKEEGETMAAVHRLKKTEERIADLKREFEVSRALVITTRAPSSGDVAGHPLVKDQYNACQETQRKRALSLLLPHTKQQERKDVEVLANTKIITEARKTLKAAAEAQLPDLPDIGSLSADKTADTGSPSTNSEFPLSTTPVSEITSLRMLRVYLRTYAFEQMVQAASSSARHRTIKRVEQTLQDLGLNSKPMVPTKAVCTEHLELRKEILTLSNLQKQLQYKEVDVSSFRDGSFAETPGTPPKQQQSPRAAEPDRTFIPESISIGGERFGKREQKHRVLKGLGRVSDAPSSPAQ